MFHEGIPYLYSILPYVLYQYTGYLYVGTKDGSVNAVPQILCSQYLILGAFGSLVYVLDLKTKVFCRKENQL